MAVSDHRGSVPTPLDLARLASEARVSKPSWWLEGGGVHWPQGGVWALAEWRAGDYIGAWGGPFPHLMPLTCAAC